jgi:RHS repeat-associated protein
MTRRSPIAGPFDTAASLGTTAIIPHTNWLGNYDSGTFVAQLNGTGPACVKRPRLQVDAQSFPSDDPDVTTGTSMDSVSICYRVEWPAEYMHVSKKNRSRGQFGPPSWMGSLVEGGKDASGQMYMRNRFYDPGTGRFTQEDPIGLAGGVNLSGYAGGDPVNFSDPYGLKVCVASGTSPGDRRWFQESLQDATNTKFNFDTNGCVEEASIKPQGKRGYSELQEIFFSLVQSNDVYTLAVGGGGLYGDGTHFDTDTRTVHIGSQDRGRLDMTVTTNRCHFGGNTRRVVASGGALLAHELLGHGTDSSFRSNGFITWMFKGAFREGNALHVQNLYHQAHGDGFQRCPSGGHF